MYLSMYPSTPVVSWSSTCSYSLSPSQSFCLFHASPSAVFFKWPLTCPLVLLLNVCLHVTPCRLRTAQHRLARTPFAMSTSSNYQFTDEQIKNMQALFTHFRILVIGRANAGKTTILQRICNATGEPVIFTPNGDMVNYMVNFHPRY